MSGGTRRKADPRKLSEWEWPIAADAVTELFDRVQRPTLFAQDVAASRVTRSVR